ncbi:lysylphosphatidylglycerol synthase transmembrane domain-containing protein [Reichenbachiella sp. MALMAid0571]|uniref:lysylphosphatidylglycerol synthase transmembrane domain-containing protein n=1 Tax=Reichenbachiella sp. MALMAid0571 TaxID=3143939 RepID=UPI0032DFA637
MDRKVRRSSSRLMDISAKKVFKVLNPRNVWIPVILGIGIVFFLFYNDPNVTSDNLHLIFDANKEGVFFSLLTLILRHAGYAYRLRLITDNEISWMRCIVIIVLWEFASAVTPSVVGGTAVAVFILTMEGLNFGKSLAFVMVTAILDNLFFVLAAPGVMLLAQGQVFPDVEAANLQIGNSLPYFFFISYGLIAIYTLIMSYGLFAKPRSFKWILLKVTSWGWLDKWRHQASMYGDQIIMASSELRGKHAKYWLMIASITIFIWCMRYITLNSIVSSFADVSFGEHMVIFSRQVIMWIVMLISPTPGSSGTAEYFFIPFFEQYLGSYTFISAIFWRLLTYYPYLLLGAIVLPKWIKKVFFKNKHKKP